MICILLYILKIIDNMKKLSLIRNQELFQGEKYLNNNKNYFEGWYFKNTNKENGISFIPGINITDKGKKAFIQIVTNEKSYFIDYDIKDFEFSFNPFYIKMEKNLFSKGFIHIDITEETQNINVYGDIKYTNIQNISTNLINPNIMGPFSYIPFMECNHAIISMKCEVNGLMTINNENMIFNDGLGYIEKDWGYSFPKSYIWCQGNNFNKTNSSFMFSIANDPLKLLEFTGIICVLIVNNNEYKFTTYNNTKLIKYNVNNKLLDITLKKGKYYLNIKSEYNLGNKLFAPINGKMEKDIYESINSTITVTLKKDNNIIFSDTSENCGLEIVKNN